MCFPAFRLEWNPNWISCFSVFCLNLSFLELIFNVLSPRKDGPLFLPQLQYLTSLVRGRRVQTTMFDKLPCLGDKFLVALGEFTVYVSDKVLRVDANVSSLQETSWSEVDVQGFES